MKKKKEKKLVICEVCNEQEAGISEYNLSGIFSCQRCSIPLCENCAEYVYGDLPYCPDCRDNQKFFCDNECKGEKEHRCRDCNYC